MLQGRIDSIVPLSVHQLLVTYMYVISDLFRGGGDQGIAP